MPPKLILPDARPSYLLWYADICLTELVVDIDERERRGRMKATERRIVNHVNGTLRELRQLGVAIYEQCRAEQRWEDVGDVLLRLLHRPERAAGLLAQLDADHAGPTMRERRTLRLAQKAKAPDGGNDPNLPPAA